MAFHDAILHCHSEHSLKDSPVHIKDLCKKAKELGAEAVSLTDHGTCTGIIEFIKAAQAENIKPIPGIEAYISDNSMLIKNMYMITTGSTTLY